jgi:hypothetical protein
MNGNKKKAALSAILCHVIREKSGRNKSFWSKNWLQKRDDLSHVALLKELQENNPNDWRNYLIIADESFEQLQLKIASLIEKRSTHLRTAISST